MSLIKSFNFAFFKQNIKKSKGATFLAILICPLILSIYLVVTGINVYSPYVVPVTVLKATDLFFMYIIPFVLSVILFGFVFKKSSTDFINSMPINRKTMFITNTIGGIILITINQLLIGFVTLLWTTIFTNLMILPNSLVDILITSWISYIFVFIASNLAMTIAGTKQSQFVAVALIVFLVPVLWELISLERETEKYDYPYGGYYSIENNYDLSITSDSETTYYDTVDTRTRYTMPFELIRGGGNYTTETIVKMVVLSAVYTVVGWQLYKRKKMEYSEESFGNLKLHILIKSLTLVPVLLFANFINYYTDSLTVTVIAIILSAVYYILFDILSKRKVPIRITLLSFVATVIVVQGVSSFLEGASHEKTVKLDIEDIKAISIGYNSNQDLWSWGLDNSYSGDAFLDDIELLDIIIKGRERVLNAGSDDYYSSYPYTSYGHKEIDFNIKTNSGKEYYIQTSIAGEYYDKLMKKLSENEEYREYITNKIINKKGIIEIRGRTLDSKSQKKIEKVLKDNIEDIELFSENNSDIYCLTKIVYFNHRIHRYKIPLNSNPELLEVVAEISNENVVKNIKKISGLNADFTVYYENGESQYCYSYEFINYIKEHANDSFDVDSKYYIIEFSGYKNSVYYTFVFYTNDIKGIDTFINDYEHRYYY